MSVTSHLTIPPPAARRRRRRVDVAGVGLWCFAGLVFTFLFAPIAIILLTSLTSATTVEFPPPGFSLHWYRVFLDTLRGAPGTHPGLAQAIWFSLYLGMLTTFFATLSGILAAFAFHKFVFRGREILQSLFLLPLIFPSLVTGVGLLLTFSELHGVAPFLRLLIGHVIVALPYVLVTVTASLKLYEEDVEEAAESLGANAFQTFWYITLPLIRPGILAGAIFAFIASFTNFTVSFFLSIGSAKPIPIWIYERIVYGYDPLVAALSVLLVSITLVLLLVLERLIGIRRIVGASD
jgi:putative spermidine/putrescine transport system permease protein